MRTRFTPFVALVTAALLMAPSTHAFAQKARGTAGRKADPPKRPALPCGDYVGFQVLLDRQGFSTGQIDGFPGTNFQHALAAWKASKNMAGPPAPDCDTWRALGGDTAEATLTTYTITDEDLKGPFQKTIPRDLNDQASLPALSYQSVAEMLGERFHASPTLLQRLNPGVTFTAGREIKVPAVKPFNADTKPAPDAAAADIVITVSKDDSSLRATKADGSIVFFAPVTTGSEHDPLPTGDYKVVGVGWKPPFHYNPKLFWDAKAGDTKATIKPGPNNPVGVLWIDLSLEHYGIHGTPEPKNVGHTESHGCVRLTNWDAARVASLVKAGTPVKFR